MLRHRLIIQVGFLLRLGNVPHFQKHERKPFRRVSFQPDCRILPVSEPFFPVDILVRQIRASRMSNPSVHNQDLPVIPVIVMAGKDRMNRSVHFAADPILFKHLRIKIRKKRQGAHAVIHYTHFYTLLYFFLQHFQDLMPEISFLDNKVFHENKFPGAPQIRHQRLKLVISQRIVRRLRSVVYRAVCIFSHILSQSSDLNVFLLQRFSCSGVLIQKFFCLDGQFLKPFVYFSGARINSDIKIKYRAEYREDHHRQHPHQTELGIPAAAEQAEQDHGHQNPKQAVNLQASLFQRPIQKIDKQKLYHKGAQDNQSSSEDNRLYTVDSLFLYVFRFHPKPPASFSSEIPGPGTHWNIHSCDSGHTLILASCPREYNGRQPIPILCDHPLHSCITFQ